MDNIEITGFAARAFGGCIEPDGMDLTAEWGEVPCPKCSQPANSWFLEHLECGSVNTYSGLRCSACGHREGDHPSDNDD